MLYLWIALGIFGGIALVIAFILLNNGLITVSRYGADIGAGSGLKIVQLSDLHGKSFGRGNSRLVKKIIAENPDVIVITGDIVHDYKLKGRETALGLVSSLKEIAPVLYIAGNHEMRNKGYRFFRKQLIEAGALVLDDCSADICGVTFVGLNCASLKNGTVERIKPPNPQNCILLAHMPQFIKSYAAAGYGLVLCGHAHGGQWRIPLTGVGIYAPGQGLFPKHTSGMHAEGNSAMIISRGLGNSQCPLRLFNPPEIVVVNLK